MFLPPKSPTAGFATVPAPVGGINAYDNLANMPQTDAISLINLIPQPYGCTVRKGSQRHSTGLGDPVNSLASWPNILGNIKLFAWAGPVSQAKMFDITTAGAVGAPMLSDLSTSWWQHIQFANAAGTHMVAFSGQDAPIVYNATGVHRLVPGNGTDPFTVSGTDPLKWIQGTIHMKRIWAVEVNTTLGWFLPADALYGVAQFFDFGPFFKRGGYLTCLATWTVDAGEGTNDHLVGISSLGDVVVFSGVDVENADTWNLVGVYYIGKPVRGRRFYTNVGGDLYILTNTGIVSMDALVTSTQVNPSPSTVYSKKIQFMISQSTSDLGDLDGWEIKFVPDHNLLFVNVPSIYANGSGQLVANHITTSWCTFRDMPGITWHVIDGNLLFGKENGTVMIALVGDKDDVGLDGTGGTDILSEAQQAYSYLGAPTVQKQIGMYRPNFILIRKVGFVSEISYDFVKGRPGFPTGSSAKSPLALWNEAIWGVDYWSGGAFPQLEWRQAQGIGVAASMSIAFSTQAETVWVSTDYTYQKGGPL